LERLTLLASMFAIDVCAYAVLSNHYHLVLHVNRDRAAEWSLQKVVVQWCKLFVAPPSVERWLRGEADDAERAAAETIIGIEPGHPSTLRREVIEPRHPPISRQNPRYA
jgi:hypothetical protein